MDLSQWIAQHASRRPDRVALRFEGRDISYAQFAARIDGIAAALAVRHVRPGDRIACGAEQPVHAGRPVRLRPRRCDLPATELAPGRARTQGHAAGQYPVAVVRRGRLRRRDGCAAGRPARHGLHRARRGRPARMDALGGIPRRRPRTLVTRAGQFRFRSAALLHLRIDRAPQGRAAEPGGAGLQCREQRRHAWPGQQRPGAHHPPAVPRRRAQHPHPARAAGGLYRHASSQVRSRRDLRCDRARSHHPHRAGAGPARRHAGPSALGGGRSVQPAHDHHRVHPGRRSASSARCMRAACR